MQRIAAITAGAGLERIACGSCENRFEVLAAGLHQLADVPVIRRATESNRYEEGFCVWLAAGLGLLLHSRLQVIHSCAKAVAQAQVQGPPKEGCPDLIPELAPGMEKTQRPLS